MGGDGGRGARGREVAQLWSSQLWCAQEDGPVAQDAGDEMWSPNFEAQRW